MVSSIAGYVILTQVHTVPLLVGGRALQGLACGIASSAIGAMVIDPKRRHPWLAVGTVGLRLADVRVPGNGPTPVRLAPITRSPGLRPHRGAGRAVLAAGGALVATWSFSSVYQAFAPGLTADYLGTTSALMIAVVFASVVILSPLGGICTGGWRPMSAQRAGLAVFVVGAVVAVVSLHYAAITPLLVASAVTGFAQGAANDGGMRGVLAGLPAGDQAGTLSTLYLISYTGGAVPGLVAGQLTNTLALPEIGTAYIAVVVVAGIVAVSVGLAVPRR